LRQQLRWWWTVPLLGLVPLVVAVVLASEGVFNAPPRQPVTGGQSVASGPPATVGALATQAAVAQTQPVATQPAAAPVSTQPLATLASAPQPTPIATARATLQSSVTAPTATTPASTTIGATGPFRAYLVQPGDTVRFVADMYGVSSASIIQASGLQNPDQLRVGQVLTVPSQPGWLYRIQPGETLDLIAARTGVSTELIASASKLSNTTVRPGDVILIPDQSIARSK
jgi:LysM repeat protein